MPRPATHEAPSGIWALDRYLRSGRRASRVVTRQRPNYRLWGRLFIAVLLLPTMMQIGGFHPNDVTEEEFLAPVPSLDIGRLLDGDYYRELDQQLADRLAIRGLGQWARGSVDYELFNDSTSPLVFAGSDDWLYWLPHLELPCDELAAISIPETPNVGEDRLRVVIAAPKASIHHEPYGELRPCALTSRFAWTARAATDSRYIDVNRPLVSAHRADPTIDLFYRRATDWSPAGRLLVAEKLIDSIQPGLWNERAVRDRSASPFAENLMNEIGIDSSATLPDYTIRRLGQLVAVGQTALPTFGDSRLVKVTEMVDNARVVEGTTVLVGDDNFSNLLPYIDQFFERLVFVHWTGLAFGHDLGQYDADRAVVAMAESRATATLSSAFFDRIVEALDPGDAA